MLTTLGLVVKKINSHHVKVVYLLCHAKISQSMDGSFDRVLGIVGKSLDEIRLH
jgi:hypothetical protein